MENPRTTVKSAGLARRTNRHLPEGPLNADRVLWGACAVTSFASAAGMKGDLKKDPKTVLGDLLADLMHWSDARNAVDLLAEPIDFELALRLARNHYREESVGAKSTRALTGASPKNTFRFERGISAKLRAEVLDRNGFTCQMCGLTPGDIDPATGRKVRLHLGHIKDKSLGGKIELSNLRALCSTCNQGAKNITGEKPTTIWLLSQIRRAGQDEQRAVLNWLSKKFGASKDNG